MIAATVQSEYFMRLIIDDAISSLEDGLEASLCGGPGRLFGVRRQNARGSFGFSVVFALLNVVALKKQRNDLGESRRAGCRASGASKFRESGESGRWAIRRAFGGRRPIYGMIRQRDGTNFAKDRHFFGSGADVFIGLSEELCFVFTARRKARVGTISGSWRRQSPL